MSADMYVDYKSHLRHGNVWGVEVELPLQGGEEDDVDSISITVDIIAQDRELARYIVATMYPDYNSVAVDNLPMNEDDVE